MANKENQPLSFGTPPPPPISGLSPSNKPALNRQRDHSSCRRPETPLKVRKTRENLNQNYIDVLPPCLHLSPQGYTNQNHVHAPNTLQEQKGRGDAGQQTLHQERVSYADEYAPIPEVPVAPVIKSSRMQRQKSVSRRMLSRVKQGITSRSNSAASIRPAESDTSLSRRLSGRRKHSVEPERRTQSFEISRPSGNDAAQSARDQGPTVRRSFRDSTLSTESVLSCESRAATPRPVNDDCSAVALVPSRYDFPSPPSRSSPSPQPTPRPPRKELLVVPQPTTPETRLKVPCVHLQVTLDRTSVDVHSKGEVWVAMEATVGSEGTFVQSCALGGEVRDTHEIKCGSITSLRLCFKPVGGCLIADLVGQKALKNLTDGERCSLFLKIQVPKIRVRDSANDPDQYSLFTELESMVGTLETDILNVEARYRHSLLPRDNVVSVKHTCKITRPKTESRWSLLAHYEELDNETKVHTRLAQYLTDQYSAERASELLHRHLSPKALQQQDIRRISAALTEQMSRPQPEEAKPSVIITDIDLNSTLSTVQATEPFSTAPTTPSSHTADPPQTSTSTLIPHDPPANQTPIPAASGRAQPNTHSHTLAPPLLTAPKTTTSLTATSHNPSEPESRDSAHRLWRHIRHSSLSEQQLSELTPERLGSLEDRDESLKELRRVALANKRSVGAETLKGWAWDRERREGGAEAPWL